MTTFRKTQLFFILFLLAAFRTQAIQSKSGDFPNAGKILSVTSDSLILLSGTTYSYTVDTPENEGLVSTVLTAEELLELLEPKRGDSYKIGDKYGKPKQSGPLQSGDRLELITGKGIVKERKHIGLQPAAISPRLELHEKEVAAGTPRDITLDFYAGQRTPMAKIEIYVPEGIQVTLDNTTVNVIGRGEVTLRTLPTQSIGRTGTHYSYNRVGHASIGKTPEGMILVLTGLDLRPANGPDLRICLKGVKLPATGDYTFKARYTTTQPEVLISPLEQTTLQAVNTISDFRREVLRAFTYNPGHDFTSLTFYWSPAEGATDVTLMESTDGGKSWKQNPAGISAASRKVTVKNLRPNQHYQFKLIVKGATAKGDSNIA